MKRALGVCYYPEHWPEAQWTEDATRMAALGLTWVRIGEFAWSRMEPAEGRYDWGWLDRAIAVLGAAGLKVVLGTPTATPPRWVLAKHPDMLAVDRNGDPRGFGSRRHYDFSHRGYRQDSARIVQAMAECLAGVVYANAIKKGAPCIFGTWPFVSDLRTGAMSGGSAEQALLTAGCAQMHRFYNLPGGAASGISDSKLPDMQAGWEQGITNALAGLSGLNMCYEAVGMHASLLGFCLESLVLGDDLLGQAMRLVRGIDVTPDSTSIEAMKEVCLGGPGHYLGSDQTLKLMQTEYIYPKVGNRMSPKEWNEAGKPQLLDRAIARKHDLLARADDGLGLLARGVPQAVVVLRIHDRIPRAVRYG